MTNRKVILYIATSIDGFIADHHGGIDWLETNSKNEEQDTSYTDFYQGVDTVILGRTTYDQVVNDLSPDIYPYEDSMSYILTSKKKENTDKQIFLNTPVVDLVTTLLKQPGKDIFIVGGTSIITPLIEANLIDDYQIATIPIILGDGIPLFEKIPNSVILTPTSTKLVNHIIYRTYTKN